MSIVVVLTLFLGCAVLFIGLTFYLGQRLSSARVESHTDDWTDEREG